MAIGINSKNVSKSTDSLFVNRAFMFKGVYSACMPFLFNINEYVLIEMM